MHNGVHGTTRYKKQVSIGRPIDEEEVVHTYDGLLVSHKKK